MKKSILVACMLTSFAVTGSFANNPVQDKTTTKTTTTTAVKKSTPMHTKTTTKAVHKKHVKHAE